MRIYARARRAILNKILRPAHFCAPRRAQKAACARARPRGTRYSAASETFACKSFPMLVFGPVLFCPRPGCASHFFVALLARVLHTRIYVIVFFIEHTSITAFSLASCRRQTRKIPYEIFSKSVSTCTDISNRFLCVVCLALP